jgi:hypothetical protein
MDVYHFKNFEILDPDAGELLGGACFALPWHRLMTGRYSTALARHWENAALLLFD